MLSQNRTENPFRGKVRVRVMGILQKNDKILFLKHNQVGPAGYLWSPPGGGVEFGESLQEALKKEFLEETHLEIKVEDYLFVNEFIDNQYHALEFFFSVKHVSGNLKLGSDPELPSDKQMLVEAKFFSRAELAKLNPDTIHNIFKTADVSDKITDLKGLFTFKH